jgi:hypothetical protein
VEQKTNYWQREQALRIVLDASCRHRGEDSFAIQYDRSDMDLLSRMADALHLIGYDAELSYAEGSQLIASRRGACRQFEIY